MDDPRLLYARERVSYTWRTEGGPDDRDDHGYAIKELTFRGTASILAINTTANLSRI